MERSTLTRWLHFERYYAYSGFRLAAECVGYSVVHECENPGESGRIWRCFRIFHKIRALVLDSAAVHMLLDMGKIDFVNRWGTSRYLRKRSSNVRTMSVSTWISHWAYVASTHFQRESTPFLDFQASAAESGITGHVINAYKFGCL